jgi:succinyl-diaminopimelate desuccinylase
MSDLDRVFECIEGYRDEIIELQRELTARPALGPVNEGTGEHEKAAYIRKKLEGLNPDSLEEFRAPDEKAEGGYRPNLVARWEGEKPGPVLWVLSHMDVVPPGDLSLWETDPFQIKVEGDRITGRGVEDNQHGIVSSLIAVKAIRELELRPVRGIGLVMVADEETGSEYGLDYILKNHGNLFSPEDFIIVPDSGNESGTMIEVAEKSMLWLKFTVTGRQCHGSTPHKGKNSLYGAARIIIALEELKETYGEEDPLFSPPSSTFEPTKKEANVPNINTIPGRDVFYMDCRVLPRHGVDRIIASAENIARETARELDLDVSVETVYRQDATNPTPADAPVVAALATAIAEVKGLEAVPMGIGGGTVAAFFRRAGLPAAVWETAPDTAHQPNEWCLISDLISDAKVLAHICMNP